MLRQAFRRHIPKGTGKRRRRKQRPHRGPLSPARLLGLGTLTGCYEEDLNAVLDLYAQEKDKYPVAVTSTPKRKKGKKRKIPAPVPVSLHVKRSKEPMSDLNYNALEEL